MLPGLADWLNAPPAAYAHLPIGMGIEATENPSARTFLKERNIKDSSRKEEERASLPDGFHNLLALRLINIRMTACKQSWDKKALIVRLQEAAGLKTMALLKVAKYGRSGWPEIFIKLGFRPFEIKTVRIEKSSQWREVPVIEEK
jgi:alpha-mannosidase